MRRRLRSIVAIGIGALLVMPATAGATLVFVRQPLKPVVWVAADDGSGQHRLAPGSNPRVSPDGQTVAYLRIRRTGGFRPELMVVPADGSAPPRRLLANWGQSWIFDWSPDSQTIATVRGPELGVKRLVLIDVASGVQRSVAQGYFNGVSFAPSGSSLSDGGQLVYGRSAREQFPPRSDLYRLDMLPAGSQSIAFGPLALLAERPRRITSDHRSYSPLWGPDGEIVFVKQLGAKQRRYGPKNELYLMTPGGEGVRRLTHTKVDPLLWGLSPTDWSADGSRLLAEFGGQDTSYAVAVNPQTGAQRPLTAEREIGFVGAALSADGRTVLGSVGEFEGNVRGRKVLALPYAGGKPKVLAKNASEPDWSR